MAKTRTTLKFADEHLEGLRVGAKTITVREPELYDELDPGDRLDLVDEDETQFGEATVSGVGRTPADVFVRKDYDGHRSYRSVGQFLDQLRSYFPEREWHPDADVAAVFLDRVTVDEAYFTRQRRRGDRRDNCQRGP